MNSARSFSSISNAILYTSALVTCTALLHTHILILERMYYYVKRILKNREEKEKWLSS